MHSDIPARLAALRATFDASGIDLFLVPSADEFQSEYTPAWRSRREYLSGFDGSAGDLLVGRDEAWLFVDGRYHLQADDQLAGTGIEARHLGKPGVLPLRPFARTLAEQHPGLRFGVDPMVLSTLGGRELKKTLAKAGATWVELDRNPVDAIWSDRPTPPATPLIPVPADWSGASCSEKLAALRADLQDAGADALVSVKLDQIAWLLNLRSGDDIPFNPVFEAFLHVDENACHLFLQGGDSRLPEGWSERPEGLVCHPLEEIASFLETRSERVLLDVTATTSGLVSALERGGSTFVEALSPLEKRKAIKNEAEREQMRYANLQASIAKTRAMLWLRREIAAGRPVCERSFKERIEALYAERPGFFDLSFRTIAATGEHGAIIHYGSSDETPLLEGEIFLVDSGAHFQGGTTDDTRCFAVGACDDEARRVFTAVLRGHIHAAFQRVPAGTVGGALDAITRAPLWQEGLNYSHGTGHGVGAFLCVHEGPFSISERGRSTHGPQPLKDGMVSSIEPGYYRPGWGGVRLENLYLYREEENEAGRWLSLEPLTFIPFDPALVDRARLQPEELEWLDAYHAHCLELLEPELPSEEFAELRALLQTS